MAYKAHSQNVPIPYMDLQTLWNDRRHPHDNPLGSSPRREDGRAPAPSGLGATIDAIYRPQLGPDPESGPSRDEIVNQRLYTSGRPR
jgi:hypothetical protein